MLLCSQMSGCLVRQFAALVQQAAPAASYVASQSLQHAQQHKCYYNSSSSDNSAEADTTQLQLQANTSTSSTTFNSSSLGLWARSSLCLSRSSSDSSIASARGFASVSRASAHAGCGHAHHHDEPCTDEATAQIKEAADLQQLQELVQQHVSAGAAPTTTTSSSDDSPAGMTAGRAAAAFRRAAVLANKTPAAADPVVNLLVMIWPGVLAGAVGKDLADALLSWTKLQLQDASLWAATLAAVPAQIKVAGGEDLANIAFALAAMSEANGGSVPGVSRPDVQDLLRDVTSEVVSLVQGGGAGDGAGDGGEKRSVSVGNLSTVRWAHEVFEECGEMEG